MTLIVSEEAGNEENRDVSAINACWQNIYRNQENLILVSRVNKNKYQILDNDDTPISASLFSSLRASLHKNIFMLLCLYEYAPHH